MDQFREEQRRVSPDGGSLGGSYGCPCCRKHSNLCKHKVWSRKIARVRSNRAFKKEVSEELNEPIHGDISEVDESGFEIVTD